MSRTKLHYFGLKNLKNVDVEKFLDRIISSLLKFFKHFVKKVIHFTHLIEKSEILFAFCQNILKHFSQFIQKFKPF